MVSMTCLSSMELQGLKMDSGDCAAVETSSGDEHNPAGRLFYRVRERPNSCSFGPRKSLLSEGQHRLDSFEVLLAARVGRYSLGVWSHLKLPPLFVLGSVSKPHCCENLVRVEQSSPSPSVV